MWLDSAQAAETPEEPALCEELPVARGKIAWEPTRYGEKEILSMQPVSLQTGSSLRCPHMAHVNMKQTPPP